MYNVERTWARPPQTVRLPRSVPLSRWKGATPTKAAIWRRWSVPSSGSSAKRLTEVTCPTPGTPWSKRSLASHRGLFLIHRAVWPSMFLRRFSSRAIGLAMSLRVAGEASGHRFVSAVSIPISWRRRVNKASKAWSCSSFIGRWGGADDLAKMGEDIRPHLESPLHRSLQITVAESVGVESHGRYYDSAGALRDMVPNHIVQLLTFIAMEPPTSFAADALRDEHAGSRDAVGNMALIAPGTGLGEAGLYWDGIQHRPFASEGGHADFAPRNALEMELLERYDHVSY